MLAVADSLVARHNVAVPAGLGIPGKGGLIYSSWYPLQSFLAVPVVAVALKASSVLHVPVHYAESLSVTVLPALYTALTVPLVYLLALSLGSADMGAWVAAFTYGFSTFALAYTRDFYADPLLAVLMAAALLLTFEQGAWWMILSATALAVLAKPTGIILGPVLSAYLFWKTRRFWLSLLAGDWKRRRPRDVFSLQFLPLRKFSHVRAAVGIFLQVRPARHGGNAHQSRRRADLVLPMRDLVPGRALANQNAAARSLDDCRSCGHVCAFTFLLSDARAWRLVVGTAAFAPDPPRSCGLDGRAHAMPGAKPWCYPPFSASS